ncbi:helix-turn-helix domain-containing protein [Trichococcus pasteurii]|uniref:HTH cro/C1-type domain-containing protein n=1 Tax=Trichococcus pasteurii TaxID=43064 RepID=A0A1W1ID04_9LACT|nr:helix-turn-helix transcriptional regulator [Trichococcus pasteurii]SFE36758.1 Helix-turn-helix [Trichococcus pasteurii]SLM50880.1 Hypothetical protein TPAS_552 [Trichococcus pasteurii]SSB91761.1 Hypothetical protein TPAS_552 [Trichococcus pasteurii]
MDINKNEVGFRISSIRKQLGLNQELFGEKISNAHKSLVSKWEKGQSLPNNERLKIIADLGGITVDELLHGNQYEYAYNLINDLYDQLDASKKVLSEDKREAIMEDILQRVTNSPISKRMDYLSPKYKEYITVMFEIHFDDYFIKEVISNENAISLVINKLESIQFFIDDYFSYDPERATTIITEKLDPELEVKLYDLIEDARISAEILTQKYKKN